MTRAAGVARVVSCLALGCGGRTELADSRDADLGEEDVQVSLCASDDAGQSFSTFIADASIGRTCDPFSANVVIKNTGDTWIGPMTVKTLFVPSAGVSWPVSTKGTTPAPPGATFVLPVMNPGSCSPLSCPGPVEVEIEIAGTGIPNGTRPCGMATVGGC